ncbi:unnamed protein product [Prunus brigantina]
MTLMFEKRILKYEEVMQDILMHDRMVQRFGGVSQGSRERGRLSKLKGKKSNREDQTPRQKTVVLNDSDGEILFTDSIINTDALAISSKVSSSNMILDSGCSYHMFSNKSWFDRYETDYGSEVMMGDGSICRFERACTIKVKMHDGIVRTLGMIKYIPKLKKNIISFGTFDKNGYSYKAKEGKFIISKEKSEVFTKFKECKVEIENLTARKNNILRSDNGGEYKDRKFMEFCKSEGVKRHFILKKMP